MSVLIKGMEMPTSCYDCNCFIRDSDGSDYCCLLMRDIEDNYKRDDDCPLVPVPPHGDLIDRDALISRCKDEKGSYYGHDSAVIGEAVESAPMVIEAEEGVQAAAGTKARMLNIDDLRNETPENFARFLADIATCRGCMAARDLCNVNRTTCAQAWCSWLLQEDGAI